MKNKANLERIKNLKREITFLINRSGQIFFHHIDLFHDHEDLLIENKLNEKDVCRLVYDPNSDDLSFCGIPGVFASCNVLWNALPFELKSSHLSTIQRFIDSYDEIVQYAQEHAAEYQPDMAAKFVQTMNRVYMIRNKEEDKRRVEWEAACKEWYSWTKQYPVLKYLDAEKECNKLAETGMIGQFFRTSDNVQYNDYLQDCIERAQEEYKRISITRCSSFIEEQAIEQPGSTDTQKTYKIRMKMDLANFLETAYSIIEESGEPAALYFKLGGKLLYDVISTIARKAIEIDDPDILGLLERIKMVEPLQNTKDKPVLEIMKEIENEFLSKETGSD